MKLKEFIDKILDINHTIIELSFKDCENINTGTIEELERDTFYNGYSMWKEQEIEFFYVQERNKILIKIEKF